jgi:type II secretory pathway pseudopilin PulG
MRDEQVFTPSNKKGFSLIEVVLAIGIFLVTVLALVGLLGPTLQSVDDVEKTDEVSSIVNTVNAFLHNSDAISAGSNFESIFDAVSTGNSATLFVYQAYRDNSEAVELKVGFESSISVADPVGAVTEGDLADAAGTIYRVVLTPSSVIPLTGTNPSGTSVTYRSSTRNTSTDTYTLSATYATYWEGSFAMEVRIYAEDPGTTFTYIKDLTALKNEVPVFTYNTAVVR